MGQTLQKQRSVAMEMMTMMSTLLTNGGEPPNDNAYHKTQPQNIDLTIGCLSMFKIIKASQSCII
jgi:hypothetical protein